MHLFAVSHHDLYRVAINYVDTNNVSSGSCHSLHTVHGFEQLSYTTNELSCINIVLSYRMVQWKFLRYNSVVLKGNRSGGPGFCFLKV